MVKYYLVYEGLQRYRDGSVRKRTRVVRLGNFIKRPKIIDIEIDEPTGRGVVQIEAKYKIKSTDIPETEIEPAIIMRCDTGTIYPRSRYTRRAYRRGPYIVTKRFTVTLGNLASKRSVRITTRPPKGL